MTVGGWTAGLAALALAAGAPARDAPRDGPDAGMTGDIAPVHDPVIIRQGGTYYVYGTGLGGEMLSVRTSKDLVGWTAAPSPFARLPGWATTAIPGAAGMWAPDISRGADGRYRLYYSVSTFGSNRSAIGLATGATLDPAAPGYGWRDEGMVVMSTARDDYNAIDPNHVVDADGRHWLALGSFWSGIKLFALNPRTGKLLDPAGKPYALARRPAPAGGPAPVEAPFIIGHGGHYWLLASYDYCCKGANSTYYTVVGRSKAITGPYLGRDGSAMMAGGGTILLRADLQERQRFRGPGHPGVLRDAGGDAGGNAGGRDYVVYHAYDKANDGAPTLRIAPIRWGADGWPVAEQRP